MTTLQQPARHALEGIRVIEVARVPPAELPGMMLADFGADVVKVESPAGSNPHGSGDDRDAAFSPTNRNKRSIVLNLKAVEAKQIFQKLVRDADVLIEGFRPGVMSRLGLGYEDLREINPRLVYCAISSFGQDGPYRMRPAHDMNFMAMSGALSLMGTPGSEPLVPSNMVADLGGGAMHALAGILTALLARDRTGSGQMVDISYLDSTMALIGASMGMRHFFGRGQYTAPGQGMAGLTYPYYRFYHTKDHRLLAVACSEMPLWINFCKAIGRPDLAQVTRTSDTYGRGANDKELSAAAEVAAVIASRDAADWDTLLAEENVCCSIVRTVEEAVDDPQIRHRRMIRELPHPEYEKVRYVGPAIKLSETPARLDRVGPRSGEHTAEILGEIGYAESEVARLRTAAVIG